MDFCKMGLNIFEFKILILQIFQYYYRVKLWKEVLYNKIFFLYFLNLFKNVFFTISESIDDDDFLLKFIQKNV
jgi:hypothetical protein